jgi:hypothetical protein
LLGQSFAERHYSERALRWPERAESHCRSGSRGTPRP